MTDTPNGAPTPTPDLERHARTKVTRLPYLLVALIAMIVVALFGALTWQSRQTAHSEMIGPIATPPAAQAAPEAQR